MIAHAMTVAVRTHPRTGLEPGQADALRLWSAVASAHAVLDELLDADRDCPVLGSDAVEVLLPLAEATEGRLRMHELAMRSHLTPSGLTRRIDRLIDDGLVARDRCGSDRRGAYAVLTERGRAELEQALPYHARILGEMIAARLDSAAVDGLIADLESLAAARR
jgi:DNA-binding MarR family transcriptional regulator